MDVFEARGARKSIMIEVFQCKKKELVYVLVPETYNNDPHLKTFENIIAVDSSVQFWREGIPSLEMLKEVD